MHGTPRDKVGSTARGMMLGLLLGAAVGTLTFVITLNAVWISLAGVGLALGLGIGAALEARAGRGGEGGER